MPLFSGYSPPFFVGATVHKFCFKFPDDTDKPLPSQAGRFFLPVLGRLESPIFEGLGVRSLKSKCGDGEIPDPYRLGAFGVLTSLHI
jgi:hypothetical protein